MGGNRNMNMNGGSNKNNEELPQPVAQGNGTQAETQGNVNKGSAPVKKPTTEKAIELMDYITSEVFLGQRMYNIPDYRNELPYTLKDEKIANKITDQEIKDLLNYLIYDAKKDKDKDNLTLIYERYKAITKDSGNDFRKGLGSVRNGISRRFGSLFSRNKEGGGKRRRTRKVNKNRRKTMKAKNMRRKNKNKSSKRKKSKTSRRR